MKEDRPTYGNQSFYYENFYSRVLGTKTKGLFSLLSSYPHKLLEKPFPSNKGMRIVEMGVGQGEHIPFVKQDFMEYVAVDLFSESLQVVGSSFPNVHTLQSDVENTLLKEDTFDRLIATCILAHLSDPEQALRHWYSLVRDKGVMSIYLPAEPGLSLRIFRNSLPKRKAESMGFEGYDLFIAREHKSSLFRLLVLIKETLPSSDITIKRRPFPFLGWYLNLFYLVEIRVKKS